jgi:cell division protein FtsB
MALLTKIWTVSKPIVLNKYIIVLLVYFVFLTFIVDHNLILRWETAQRIKVLEKEYEYFQKEIENNKLIMLKLQNDKAYLEKFAREEYHMKKKGEEIFVIKE